MHQKSNKSALTRHLAFMHVFFRCRLVIYINWIAAEMECTFPHHWLYINLFTPVISHRHIC